MLDELLLVERRQPTSNETFTADNLRGPTEEEIRIATQNVEEKNTLKLPPTAECTADVRNFLYLFIIAYRRILWLYQELLLFNKISY